MTICLSLGQGNERLNTKVVLKGERRNVNEPSVVVAPRETAAWLHVKRGDCTRQAPSAVSSANANADRFERRASVESRAWC
jgi:hypothetical protein